VDQSIYQKREVSLILTEGELLWKKFLTYDIMLNPSKFIEEEFEWHCKEGIPKNINLLLNEFNKFRRLRPLKIILNCVDKDVRNYYAKRLSKFYNIPIINYEKIIEMLSLKIEELAEEEKVIKNKYIVLKEKMEFLNNNPDYINEENLLLCDPTEIIIEGLKYLLKENACNNRGYVLEGMPVNVEEIKMLYFYKTELTAEELGEIGGEVEMEGEEIEALEGMEVIDQNEMVDIKGMEETKQPEDDGEKNSQMDDEQNEKNISGMDGEIEDMEDMENLEKYDAQDKNVINDPPKEEVKPKKKKKIKPKKYKTLFDKTLLPESVITISFPDTNSYEVDNIFWEVENFYQENNTEILNLLFNQTELDDKLIEEKANEIFEMMRIYIERVFLFILN
jgi:hypothetical protein